MTFNQLGIIWLIGAGAALAALVNLNAESHAASMVFALIAIGCFVAVIRDGR
jgi:hypothetical protein